MGKRFKKRAIVSLCMIVKNEERYLPDCLASAGPFVDEIIIVDTGSTDRTVEIAAAAGARVFHEEWRDDFAAARNRSLGHAAGDWILVLDADECVDGESGQLIRQLIAEDDNIAFLVNVVCQDPTGHNGITRYQWLPRLFRNRIGARYTGRVHEAVLPSLHRKGRVSHSDVTIRHSGYLQSARVMEAKARRNLVLLQEEVLDHPDDGLVWLHLARTWQTLRDQDRALDAYRKAVALLSAEKRTATLSVSDDLLASAYYELGDIYRIMGRFSEAAEALQSSIASAPDLSIAYLSMGQLLTAQGGFDDAIAYYAHCIDLASRQMKPGQPVRIAAWPVWLLKAEAEIARGRYNQAGLSVSEAIRLKPDMTEGYTLMGALNIILDRPAEALRALLKAQELGAGGERFLTLLGQARAWVNDNGDSGVRSGGDRARP